MQQTLHYRDIPSNSVFKVLKPESHSGRTIKNHGLYRKVAQSHSVDYASGKDAIFEPSTPCRVVNKHANTFASPRI